MNILNKIKGFFSTLSSGGSLGYEAPEDKVNELCAVINASYNDDLTKEQQLTTLRAVVEKDWTINGRVELLRTPLNDSGRDISTLDELANYRVALGDTILNLLGEDTMSDYQKSFLDREMNENARRGRELQRARVNLAAIDKTSLRDALYGVQSIKTVWKINQDPRWNFCCITPLEAWAKDEWIKARNSAK
jgi:hypothetical protein